MFFQPFRGIGLSGNQCQKTNYSSGSAIRHLSDEGLSQPVCWIRWRLVFQVYQKDTFLLVDMHNILPDKGILAWWS